MADSTKPRRTASAGGAFLDFMAVFDPGIQHLVEERDRQERDVVLPGDADKDWDVDLDAGVARRTAPRTVGDPGTPRT